MRRAIIGMTVALAVAVLAESAPAQDSTSSINPAADAFVNSAHPDNNYGAAGALSVAGSSVSSGQADSLLRFDLASTIGQFDSALGTGQWQIQSVSLRLTAAFPQNSIFHNPSAAGSIAATWQVDDNWDEGTGTPNNLSTAGITFNTLSSVIGGGDESLGSLAYDGSTTGATTYPLTLSNGFLTDITAGGSVSLRLSPGDVNVSGVFNSENYTQIAANRPVLVVTANEIPEPATGVLVLGAGVAAVWRRRRM